MSTEMKSEVYQNDYLFIRSEGMINKLTYDQVLFLEASRNNTKVVTPQGSFLSTMPLSSIEKLLPPELFSRVHRSFIVNRSKITSLQGNQILINKSKIPMGNHYKSNFLKILGIGTK